MGLTLGAYLSQPVTDKYSSDEENGKIIYGVSSMQGWRETQEDAHNCILNFDTDTSLFAVYDGHGGNEVSEYSSQYLPDFIKENDFYKKGDYENALKDSFVKFDCTLKEPEVVKVLQKLAKYNDDDENLESDLEEENLGSLKAEAQMPIEEVMAKYVSNHIEERKSSNNVGSQSSEKSTAANVKDVRCRETISSETECGSSKLQFKNSNESDSEVSSSSSGTVSKKSTSEKYKSNGEVGKTLLDSTSNGVEELNSSGDSKCKSKNINEGSENSVLKDKADSENKKGCRNEEPVEFASSSEIVISDEEKLNCNGKSMVNRVEEAISSSVGNGETDGINSSSSSGSTSKESIKPLLKSTDRKDNDSFRNLFQKYIQSDNNDDLSESDSDDVTFNGPESTSDEDDDEDSEGNEGEDSEKNINNEKNEDDDEDDDDDDDDDEEDEDDSEEDDYENEMDRCFLEPGSDSGCTALVALIKGQKMYVANAGDCRCVVSLNGKAVEMSLDHKPENDIELERIEKAGGRVNAGRVNDGLNLSRALGDHVYKRTEGLSPIEQMISPLPDIKVVDLDPDVEFMVLACDGIWNSMSSEEVVEFVRPRLQNRTDKISKICEEIFDHCLAPDTLCDGTGCDNMTAIIVQFKNSKFYSSKKRPIDDSEAEESTKKQKTEDVTSTNSEGLSQAEENFSEKTSNSPDTTQ